MASNKLSSRRGFLKRPPVCKEGPITLPPPRIELFFTPKVLVLEIEETKPFTVFVYNHSLPLGDNVFLQLSGTEYDPEWIYEPKNGETGTSSYMAPGDPGQFQIKCVAKFSDDHVAIAFMTVNVTPPS